MSIQIIGTGCGSDQTMWSNTADWIPKLVVAAKPPPNCSLPQAKRSCGFITFSRDAASSIGKEEVTEVSAVTAKTHTSSSYPRTVAGSLDFSRVGQSFGLDASHGSFSPFASQRDRGGWWIRWS